MGVRERKDARQRARNGESVFVWILKRTKRCEMGLFFGWEICRRWREDRAK